LFASLFFYTLYFLLIYLLSFVFWLATAANKKNKELLAAQLLLQQFKTDKLDAENKFLQSQINPHFLYNTLNFFYSKALTLSPELADSILLLSDTMRYSLELKENAKGMTLLEKEVTHIYNLIKINQYRFNNKLQIKFLISGDLQAVCIAPLVLITFVENVFKHAELLDVKNPLVISLHILKEEQLIRFNIENKIKKGPKEPGTGIGIDNAKRRLEYLYDQQYKLTIQQDADFYKASLTLPLYKDFAL
jgi:LytS/YehU family sensor histidine kinase